MPSWGFTYLPTEIFHRASQTKAPRSSICFRLKNDFTGGSCFKLLVQLGFAPLRRTMVVTSISDMAAPITSYHVSPGAGWVPQIWWLSSAGDTLRLGSEKGMGKTRYGQVNKMNETLRIHYTYSTSLYIIHKHTANFHYDTLDNTHDGRPRPCSRGGSQVFNESWGMAAEKVPLRHS